MQKTWREIAVSLVVLLVSITASCQAHKTHNQGRVVVAYVTSWSQDMPDPGLMTHINYAFGKVTSSHDGVSIDNPDRLHSIVTLKKQNPQLKILLSIGGWGAGGFSEMASEEISRERFSTACAKTVDEYGLDGIDIDWEYPGSNAAGISCSNADRKNFTLLMKALRKALGNNHLLTLATAASGNFYDFPSFINEVDFVNMMTYDMDGAPQHHAPLFNSERFQGGTCEKAMLAHLQQGVPAEKLVLGLPFYGRGSEEVGNFKDFREIIKLTGLVKHWDRQAQVPYMTDPEGRVVLGYDDVRSIKAKCKYARKRHLHGVMYWDYHGDSPDGILSKTVWKATK